MTTFLNHLRLRRAVFSLVGAVVVAGSVLVLAQSSKPKVNAADLNVPVDKTAVPRDTLPRGSFAPIVDKVAPAVVKIETTATIRNNTMEEYPGFNDPFWRQFFGNQFSRSFPATP